MSPNVTRAGCKIVISEEGEPATVPPFLYGENNVQEYAEQFYKSQAWRDCRRAYLKSRGGLCERCLAKGFYNPAEIIHHKVHLTPENITDPAVSLSWDNLEALCRRCHGREHERIHRRWSVDELGRISPRDD